MPTAAPGIILAAPASGQGKTIATLAIVRALTHRGLRVAAAKAGPDYIDPAFHAAAGGNPCLNLDVWAMRPETLGANVAALGAQADIVICEGVMGLFDGAGNGLGSTADLAATTGWPVILIADVRGQAASAAATLRGFATHRKDVPLAGAILNRVGGPDHRRMLAEAIGAALPKLPVLGCLPRDQALALPERHLGLVQAGEHPALDAFLDRAAGIAAENIDLEALRALARPSVIAGKEATPLPPPGQRIAVARDEVFTFTYESVLQGWRNAGAEISHFSPLADEAPAPDADTVWLPGGYPELQAGRLAGNTRFMEGLRAAVDRRAAVHGECGGYMVLGRGLEDADGRRHAMAGLLPLETSFAKRRLHLGYRQATANNDWTLGRAGATFRGHEFHYAAVLDEAADRALFRLSDAKGEDLGHAGLALGRVSGSFIHLIDRAS